MPAADRDEFARLYDELVWDVYGFFGYRLSSREVAEDLTQLTFERAFRAWHRFDPARASPRTWVLAIGRNVLIDHYRRSGTRREEPVSDESLEQYAGGGMDAQGSIGLDAELDSALRELPDRERELLALRYGGDLSGPEIAELTGLSLANVQQILSRTLRTLRARLEGEPRPKR